MRRRQYVFFVTTGLTSMVAGCTLDSGRNDAPSDLREDDDTTDDTSGDSAVESSDDSPEETNGGDDDDVALLGETLETQDGISSFEFEMRFLDPEVDFEPRGRVHHGDFYYQLETPEGLIEYFVVDDDVYMVMDDFCFKNPGEEEDPAEVEPEDEVDFDDHAEIAEQHPDIEWVDRDDIDGVAVYVYEIDEAELDEPITYYVEISTGYLRRIETAEVVIDYFNWGQASPVEEPDVECMEF